MKDETRQLELDMGSIINHSEYQASTEIVEDSNISIKKVSISSITEINPRFSSRLDSNEIISFVPMASVSEESISIENPIDRPYSEVAKGFTAFRRGDILVAKITPCFENGKMAYAENLPREFGFGSTEFHVLRVKSEVYGSYLFHLLRVPLVRRLGAMKMKGAAGQKRVPADFFASLQIPLPPLDEQKRIASILDAADELRAKRRRALAELDSLLQSVFLDMFGDPVTNPKGWEEVPLSTLAKAERGRFSPRPRNDPSYYGGVFPFIQTGDIANSGGYISVWKQTLNEKGTKVSKQFEPGTILIAIVGATIGRTAILSIPAYCPDSVVGIIAKKDIAEASYLEFVLRLRRPELLKRAPATARANINLEILRPFPILNPPLELQQKFAAIVEKVEQQKARMKEHLAELDALFASLQHRAFNGEL